MRALLLIQFSTCTRISKKKTTTKNMPSIERSCYLLNISSICVIFLYNCMRCLDGLSILLQRYVRKGNDAKKTQQFSVFVCNRNNLVPRAYVPFGQHQDTELWNNQFPETKILGLPVSRRMRGVVYVATRDKVDVDTFHKGIQYALEILAKSKFGFERTPVSNFKSKRHKGSGNELVDYSRAPCLGADQKARGLWERDCNRKNPVKCNACVVARKIETGCFSRNVPISNDPVLRISKQIGKNIDQRPCE